MRPQAACTACKKWLTRPRLKGCNSALFSRRTDPHETDIPAIQNTPQAYSRFSGAQAYPRRAEGTASPPGQGARAVERLSAVQPATLPRSARLLQRVQYTEALATGAAARRRHFAVFARPNGLTFARIGIIASKRVAARAVDRNRAKRLVREVFRGMRHRLGGVDLVVELRRCPAPGFNAEAGAELARLLEEHGAPRRA